MHVGSVNLKVWPFNYREYIPINTGEVHIIEVPGQKYGQELN